MIAIFIFYDVSTGIQAQLAFSSEFRHCNIITYDGEYWIAHEFDSSGFITRGLKVLSGEALVRMLRVIKSASAIVTVDIGQRPRHRWTPFVVRSCNEIDRYIAGVDIGFTFNPRHLYNKLLKYNGIRNYQILTHWRRSDGLVQS